MAVFVCSSPILLYNPPIRPHQRSSIVTRTLRTDGASSSNGFSEDPVRRRGSGNNPISTRLGQLLEARRIDLLERFRETRRNLPLKVFLLLLGFYSGNALATVLGQTGDWDVLVGAIVVAVIEGIGFLMYKMPPVTEKLRFLVKMLNYWKVGLSFGLFVDGSKEP
ncbi:ycf20-like protein [Selaginella moellendorffii]|nr:ycf20-like protein [Selaginella moellendorffii]|eukprot:XP_002965295.2 ycf20-like protein [Selaginella moellendorffii]